MKRTLKIAIFSTLILAGCKDPTAPDGYTFGEKQFFREKTNVEIVQHQSLLDLRRDAPKIEGLLVMAWSEIYPDGRCVVHIIDPSVKYYPEYIGHELTHCVYGSWHDSKGFGG